MSDSLESKYQSSPFFGANAPFLEPLYEQYLQNPDSVPAHWREYFRTFERAAPGPRDIPHGPVLEDMAQRARNRRAVATDRKSVV